MRKWIRSTWRFIYFITSTILHIAGFALRTISGTPKISAATRLREKWLDHVPSAMGIHMKVEGEPYQGTCLYVANHISYVDPVAILTHVDANIVAKSEVSSWPLIGLAGYIIGTIYVNREEKSSRQRAADSVRSALQAGTSILVFPEGTTSAGPKTLPFRPRSFEAAFLAGVPVQPIAIKYDDPGVAFIGNDLFLPHFFRMFGMNKISGRVFFGPILEGENACTEARNWIDSVQSSTILSPV